MKAIVAPLALALLASVPMPAAFESASFEMTEEPAIPAVLRMNGLHEGRVALALDIAADGRLADSLVTAASHRELIKPCLDAVKMWHFTPARYDGEAVPARLNLSISLTMTGAVINRTAVDMLGDFIERVAGRPYDYQLCPPDRIDHPLVPVTRVNPNYAEDAARAGVGGRVRVFFFVDEQGTVRLPAVPAETHPYLSAVAVNAMRGWKFEPPTRDGHPVTVAAAQDFDFGGPPH